MAGAEFRRLTLGREATNDPVGGHQISPQPRCKTLAFQARAPHRLSVAGYSAADFVLGYVNSDTTPIDTIKVQW